MAEPESANTMLQNAFVKNGDGDYSLKTTGGGGGGAVTIDPSGNTVKLDQTGTNNTVKVAAGQTIAVTNTAGIPATLPTAQNATSVTANGKVTTPAALAAIATTPNLAAGTWDIEVWVFIGGTTVANLEVDNSKFNIGATPVATIIVPVAGTTGASDVANFRIRVNLGGATPVSVTVGALGTTGAIYSASIIATKKS